MQRCTAHFYPLLLLFVVSLILSTGVSAQKNKLNLLLPTVYKVPKNEENTAWWINQYWISEKYDGIRARWTGQQLLTKQGHIIYPPDSFIKNWPTTALDGELWIGRNKFDQVSSIVRKAMNAHNNSNSKNSNTKTWQNITFMIFDLPDHQGTFTARLKAMKQLLAAYPTSSLKIIPQKKIASLSKLQSTLDKVVNNQGEGLMLHHQNALYHSGRSKDLMKLKKHYDDEAKVIAHITGKGKYAGMLGSLLVETPTGITFKIGSGFTDQQRMTPPEIGCIITYKYFGKTSKGLPRFASFMRIRYLNDSANDSATNLTNGSSK